VRYLLDTCLISELLKRKPNASVLRWLDQQDEDSLFLSVLTLGEIQKGVSKLPEDKRKSDLQNWVNNDFCTRFEGRILSIDVEAASAWRTLSGNSERRGKKLPVMDSLIASTAAVHNLTVVTRNIRDMQQF
jgi:toxin FitB